MKNLKKQEGITLVALVVTIVVLLILAGITIMYVLSDNGVFGKAQSAATQTNDATAREMVAYAILGVQTALADPSDHTADTVAGAQSVFMQGIPSDHLDGTTVTCTEIVTDGGTATGTITNSNLSLSGTIKVSGTDYTFSYTPSTGLLIPAPATTD